MICIDAGWLDGPARYRRMLKKWPVYLMIALEAKWYRLMEEKAPVSEEIQQVYKGSGIEAPATVDARYWKGHESADWS